MKYITRLHLISVERGPLQVARLTGEKVSHLRHFKIKRRVVERGTFESYESYLFSLPPSSESLLAG